MRRLAANKTNWDPASYKTNNGAGDLFYAGEDGPITTIRLENVRDGIEDFELLHSLAGVRGDDDQVVRALVADLIRSLTDFERSAERFTQVRIRLLDEATAQR